MRSTRMIAATCAFFAAAIPCALARRSSVAASRAQKEAVADPVKILVDRLDLERYKATIKGLTQFGDRRQGTDRNRAALDWIEAQLKSYGCSTERIHYDYQPPAGRGGGGRGAAGGGGRGAQDPNIGPGGARRRGVRMPEGVNNDPLKQPD